MRPEGRRTATCALILAIAGCGHPPDPPDAGALRPSDPVAAAQRAACAFDRGALPIDTLGASAPLGDEMPIDTIVVLVQENRSFDSYFSHLGRYAGRSDIEAAPDSTTNPGDRGSVHYYMHAPHLCLIDTNHEWVGTHDEYDDGKMDGFFLVNDGWTDGKIPVGGEALLDGERALWWYDERDLPFYYELASRFAIADHYYSPLLGPTWPNRDYLYAATSFGVIDEHVPNLGNATYPEVDAVIFDMLEKAHVSWGIYSDGLPGPTVTIGAALAARWGRNPVLPTSAFFDQAAAGTLPQVVFIEPRLGLIGPDGNDEHPPADIQLGQQFVAQVVLALFASPQWSRSALFITYDEHGGLYDHVAPPTACPPDDKQPIVGTGTSTYDGFAHYGVRVPMTVVSPYARAHYVSHDTFDHTSILRFIETRFDLPALTGRDANAAPLFDLFDFSAPAFAAPPVLLLPPVDPVELAYCTSTFP